MKKKKISTMSSLKKKDAIFANIVFTIPFIHFIIFVILVNLGMVMYAFCSTSIDGTLRFVGLDNFKTVFGRMFGMFGMEPDGIVGPLAWKNSVEVVLLSIFVNLPITLLFAFAIYKKIFLHRYFQIMIFAPATVSTVVLCLIFRISCDTNMGIIPVILKNIGLGNIIPVSGGLLGDNNTMWPMVMVFNVWMGLSGNLIYYNSAMARLSKEVMESAELDGASEVRQFVSMAIPMIWPTLTTMTLGMISTAFSWFAPSLILTDANYHATTLGLIITQMIKSGAGATTGFVPALGLVLSLIGAPIMLAFRKIMESKWHDFEY